jgi:hypothetical protein
MRRCCYCFVQVGKVHSLRQGKELAALASQKAEIPRIHLAMLRIQEVGILREEDNRVASWSSW